jgi:uncharacterized protein YegJ (DUF2314 family)
VIIARIPLPSAMSYRYQFLSPLFAVLLVGPLSSCSRQSHEDRIVNVEADDAEMEAAIARAREKLPHFWQVFAHSDKGEGDFSLKVRIKDSHGTEHFWVTQIERKEDGEIFGVINNDPEIVKSVKLNDRVAVPEEKISDWLYMRDGKMVGNYTLRVLFKHMPPKEVEYYKQMMAEP